MPATTLPTLLRALPQARRWIGRTVRAHRDQARPVAAFGFPHLPRYFDAAFLRGSYAVVVDEPPRLPLAEWGLGELDAGSLERVSGITFLDTFFVRRECAVPGSEDESLFFHELIHVAQWRRLGFFRFSLLYGLGLAQHGYMGSPLEKTAYRLTADFDAAGEPFDARAVAARESDELAARFRRSSALARAVWMLGALVPPPRTR